MLGTRKYHKLALAEIQLHRAIDLFINYGDYPSAITLAGAAEEILGKYMLKAGGQPVMEHILDVLLRRPEVRHLSRKELRDSYMNGAKNSLKHIGIDSEDHLDMDWETEAINLIVRASINYRMLADGPSNIIKSFIELIRKKRPDLFKNYTPEKHAVLNAILEGSAN